MVELLNQEITGRKIPCKVTYKNGEIAKRTFTNTETARGLRVKGSSKRYYPVRRLERLGITRIELKQPPKKKSDIELVKYNANRFLKLVDKRLWKDLQEEVENILNIIDEWYLKWTKKENTNSFSWDLWKEFGHKWLTREKSFITVNTAFKKAVGKDLTIDIDNYLNGQDSNFLRARLIEKIDKDGYYLGYGNRTNYDNSFEVHRDEGKAWLSREFKDLGNGHYYILISPTHAVYIESD
ncbi:MAG: hypothetical protein ACOCP8_02715 [archaeon]